eukprot:scaffold153139_cov14-Prasinocladus_malaysianus.AAC.1
MRYDTQSYEYEYQNTRLSVRHCSCGTRTVRLFETSSTGIHPYCIATSDHTYRVRVGVVGHSNTQPH